MAPQDGAASARLDGAAQQKRRTVRQTPRL